MQHLASTRTIRMPFVFMMAALLLLGAMVAAPSRAGGIEELHAFIEQTRSARATFSQTVTDAQGMKVEDSNGVVEFSRPGKFRWHYLKPYEQLVIGDGNYLWVYDKDLAQVTKRKLGAALGSSPAALLAGSDDVDRYFSLESIGGEGGYEWLEVKPYDEDSLFDKVRMAFKSNSLQVMELYDHFGQTTVIRFSGFELNPRFMSGAFTFTPPPGVDVVTD